MENKKLSFATVVATPTKNSWSQVYNAGGLFAVLSITSESEETDEENSLGIVGKDILETLEKEYFTLETKNLASIKQAVVITCEKLKEREDLVFSLAVASIADATLYVFSLGDGKAILKRGTKIGTILDSGETAEVTSASGFLQDGDTIIIATKQFTKLIPKETLFNSLDHNSPSEIAENLSPKVHEQEEGGASAIVLRHQDGEKTEEAKPEMEEEILQTEEPKQNRIQLLLNNLSFPSHLPDGLTHRRKVFLTVTILLAVILFVSIFLAIKKQENDKTQRLFQEIYSQAQKKYDEGTSLSDLNNNLARDDFSQAQKILTEGRSKFSQNSTEEKQITELLKKVEEALAATSGVNKVTARPADGKSAYLDLELKNSTNTFFSQDDKNVYSIDSTSVFSIDKKTQAKKTLIKNSGSWKDVGGLAVYLGNIYVLDKTSSQILKFVPSADSGFGKSNYLPGPQDFSKASSIAIDGSIWILFQDGSIKKFTRGKQDELNVTGLDDAFVKPSRIYTHVDIDNVYILDNGNKRIVVLNKSGAYQAQYTADLLSDAKDFEVLEKDKKIFVLSQNKVWQIDLK